MIKHLFKLIWNKKRENFLLISEILISFLVMFAVFTLMVYNYQNYKEPAGFKYDHVWRADLGQPLKGDNKDSLMLALVNLKNALKSMSKVKEVSFTSGNVPFSSNMMGTNISYRNVEFQSDMYRADRDYVKVLQMTLRAGRWFNEADRSSVYQSVVLNAAAAIKLSGSVDMVGKLIKYNDKMVRVIGVTDNLKDKSDFKKTSPGIYSLIDTSSVRGINNMIIKVSPDADARFEDEMYRLIASTTKASNLEIAHLPEMKIKKNKETVIPMIILLIISGFLIFNVALGLFGVLWYNISKRKGEIGLRRALGASAAGVSGQLLGEALVLATFSLIIGSFFAVQFPLLNVYDLPAGVYLIALLLSILFIYVLVIVCALYPGKQAAAIHPAVALHED
jgi:putative ABC transport system permease protein